MAVEATDIGGIVELVERRDVDLTIVGPEAPLVAGLGDALRERRRRVFGPGAAGARLEGSKAWAKALCERHGIPTARSVTVTSFDGGDAALDGFEPPYVVKADGLAAGKGVVIATDRAEALGALRSALEDRAFGDAGSTVVIEEFLEGPEVSAFGIADGREVVVLGFAQDHKRVGDGDAGPNTGGMCAGSPVPLFDDALAAPILEEVLAPTLHRPADRRGPRGGALSSG